MTTADLDARMRQVLAQLEMCSNGTTTSYNPSGSGASGKQPGGDRPRGGDSAPHLRWANVYANADTDEQRAKVIKDAEEDLAQITGRGASAHQRPSETEDEARTAVLDATRGWRPEDATLSPAARGISARTLRAWRRAANCDPETGEPQGKWAHLTGPAARLKARDLVHRHGYSLRAAAAEMGCDKRQISRWTNHNDDIKEEVAA